jgi:hypothetical protein
MELRRSLSAWNLGFTYSERPEMELFARVTEPPAQVLRQGCRSSSRSFETLFLAHKISIDGRLFFEVERDCTDDLGESQGFEFSQDRFRRESLVEALDEGIQRYASTGHIVPALALLDVFFGHRVNYSGMPRPLATPNKQAHPS